LDGSISNVKLVIVAWWKMCAPKYGAGIVIRSCEGLNKAT